METFFIEAYIIEYLIPCLKNTIRASEIEDIKDKKLLIKAFSGITEEVIEKAKKLPGEKNSKWNSFYYEFEELFKDSKYFKKAKESAYKAMKKQNHEQQTTIIINTILEGAEDIYQAEDTILIGLFYDGKSRPIKTLGDTISRIKYAKDTKQIKEYSINEIKKLLIENDNKQLILRYKNIILYYNDDTNYSLYNLKYVKVNKPWKIVDLGYHEHLQVIDTDKYNRIK